MEAFVRISGVKDPQTDANFIELQRIIAELIAEINTLKTKAGIK